MLEPGQKAENLEIRMPLMPRLSKLICFEPTLTVTGSNADERFPVRPGDELKIALALANELIVKQKRSRFANDSAVVSCSLGIHS